MTWKLESRYNIMKEAFIKELEDVPYYCLTVDNWTDSSNQSYIGITIHHVNNSAMTGRVLGCFPLYENHTSEYLMKSIQNIFDDFKIKKDKVTAMITDGASNIKKACIDLLGKDKHLVCIAHVVSHLLPDALNNFKELNTIIDKVKAIVTQMKRSIPASDKLKEMQLKDGKTEGTILKLKLDVPTRWTTKIEMLERYILLEPYIYNAINKCEKPLNLLTREEISIVKDILPIMEPIKTVITEISGDDYPICSLIIPIINCMKQKICSTVPTTETFMIVFWNNISNLHCYFLASDRNIEIEGYMKLQLLSKTENIFVYWQNLQVNFLVLSKLATPVLATLATSVSSERLFSKAGNTKRDRRNRLTGNRLNILLFLGNCTLEEWFKISIVKDILPIMEPIKTVITEISGDDYPICSLIIPIINCMKQKICSTVPTTEPVDPKPKPIAVNTVNTNSIWDIHDSILEQSQQSTLSFSASDTNIEIEGTENIFVYWKNIQVNFPVLSKLATCVLATLATSVSSERLFSKAGNTKRDRRNRLTGNRLNMLLFLGNCTLEEWFKLYNIHTLMK
ncbi:hypothetical protein TSAR_013589 [Trichomalopsis sarcophagae]|uniref:HAT C-terminal dimerisation domain-containing protein n=1 Tax=Trichomalopsis sarcophagae TaxID=543379 RepID=A0A232EEC5_9HYME|nr:hypothetical protein TSAR_013589 [Trichomalopsis sarcophagae]